MAKFCNQCGRPLKDGEICVCQQEKRAEEREQDSAGTGNKADKDPAYIKIPLTFLDSEDGIPFRKLIGLSESEKSDVSGCFERGKKIVPDLIDSCEQEVPIKQYELCSARSRLRGLWQEGRLQVTNKRVLFRLSGRSWIGRAMNHIEFTIDEIAGINISNGVRFALWDFLLALIVGLILSQFVAAIGAAVGVLGFLIGIASYAPCILLRKKYFLKLLSLCAGFGGFIGAMLAFKAAWTVFFLFITFVAVLIFAFLFALKPSLSISVMTKCASDSPIYIWSHQTFASIMEILPGRDADKAMRELGSMIMDIQKLGDFGIEKWKE